MNSYMFQTKADDVLKISTSLFVIKKHKKICRILSMHVVLDSKPSKIQHIFLIYT